MEMFRDKKNGRKGQKQHCVDIYGTPEKENQYFGIHFIINDIHFKKLKEKNPIPIFHKAYHIDEIRITTSNRDIYLK